MGGFADQAIFTPAGLPPPFEKAPDAISQTVLDPQNHLVGGDWNHGIWIDFPYIGNGIIIPTDLTDFHIFQMG